MAAGARISGKDGAVSYGGTPTTIDVTQWSVTQSMGTKDVTDSASTGGKDFLADGYYEWNGSFEGFLEEGGTYPAIGATVDLTLTAQTGVTYAGSAIITEMNANLQVSGGDAVKVGYSFQGTGALTITNSAT